MQCWCTTTFYENTPYDCSSNLLTLKKIQHWSCGCLQFPSRLTNVIYGENKLIKVQAEGTTTTTTQRPSNPICKLCLQGLHKEIPAEKWDWFSPSVLWQAFPRKKPIHLGMFIRIHRHLCFWWLPIVHIPMLVSIVYWVKG